ncbi:MAG TPA: NADH-quinone oxidoreductase subunit F [Desulfotomaculum sp.]|nr:NADH-quinone oxidoreductase subunit F [Desulfotomaculum sp.]
MAELSLIEELRSRSDWEVLADDNLPGKQAARVKVPADKLPEAASLLTGRGAFLLTMAGVDRRPVDGCFAVYPVFANPKDGLIIEIEAVISPDRPVYPALTPVVPSAHWLEREIKDLLGITPVGHPDPRRLALHPDWPTDVHPLRKDFDAGAVVPRVSGEMEFCPVEGEGIYHIPVGPVHAGIIEPGHFRFSAFGEDVIDLQAQLFYTHRGVEKAAESKDFNHAVLVAERICGACSVSHAVSFAQAVESLAGVEIPAAASYTRSILLEMERLYNHVGDIGNMSAGIGFAYVVSRGAILKERLLRMNMRLAGHRYLRGMVIPGGVRAGVKNLPEIIAGLNGLESDLGELTEVMLSSHSLLDRMETTGVLPLQAALDLGAVGPAARASGVDRDLRRDLPHAAYGDLEFNVPVQQQGDVLRRLKQRIDECRESFGILRQAAQKLSRGMLAVKIPDLPPYRTSVGCTESARGANVHWIMSGPGNTIYRYMVRSASHCNWPVVPICLPGNIVPDFPLINKSFELCYACLDR